MVNRENRKIRIQTALRLQRRLQYDTVPLSRALLPATHNSYNFNTSLPNQVHSITEQLEMGIRRLYLDVHALPGEKVIRVCHGHADFLDTCQQIGWSTCRLRNLGQHTGCRYDAPTMQATLRDIRNFLEKPVNQHEVLIINLEDAAIDRIQQVEEALDELGDMLFTPQHLREYTSAHPRHPWPTAAQLVKQGRRVVLENSRYQYPDSSGNSRAFAVLEHPPWPNNWVRYFNSTCTAKRSFTLYYADELVVPSPLGVLYNGTAITGAMTPSTVQQLVRCGYTPSFDRVTADRLADTVWSWDLRFPIHEHTCTAMQPNGRWRSFNDTGACLRRRHHAACKEIDGDRWTLSPVVPWPSDPSVACPSGWAFAAPRDPISNARLLQSTGGDRYVWIRSDTRENADAVHVYYGLLAFFIVVVIGYRLRQSTRWRRSANRRQRI